MEVRFLALLLSTPFYFLLYIDFCLPPEFYHFILLSILPFYSLIPYYHLVTIYSLGLIVVGVRLVGLASLPVDRASSCPGAVMRLAAPPPLPRRSGGVDVPPLHVSVTHSTLYVRAPWTLLRSNGWFPYLLTMWAGRWCRRTGRYDARSEPFAPPLCVRRDAGGRSLWWRL